MTRALFVTGATGYVGSELLRGLPQAPFERVVALARGAASLPATVERVQGDLLEPSRWSAQLAGCDSVLHLAALTGKASPAEHQRVNVEGTRALVAAARAAGVHHFVYVSTIAVRFPDQRYYPYAHTKAEAERVVRESGIPFTIVRPTLVVGPRAPVLEGLALLACAPLTPIFGDGERRVQPVDVRDLAEALHEIASGEPRRVIEIGGPETLTVNELLARIRRVRTGAAPRAVHLPLAPIREVLALLEPPLRRWLPLSAGQLATFANDGVALAGYPLAHATPLDASLAAAARAAAAPDGEEVLRAECAVLARHLAGCEASPALAADYARLHAARALAPRDAFDAQLVAAARRGGLAAQLADAYGARFLPRSLLRAKLALLLALLETAPETFARIDAPPAGGALGAWLALARVGISELLLAVTGLCWLGPRHLAARLRGDG